MNYLIDESKQKPEPKSTNSVGWFFGTELFLMGSGFFGGFMWQYDPLITLLPIILLAFVTLCIWENNHR